MLKGSLGLPGVMATGEWCSGRREAPAHATILAGVVLAVVDVNFTPGPLPALRAGAEYLGATWTLNPSPNRPLESRETPKTATTTIPDLSSARAALAPAPAGVVQAWVPSDLTSAG